jgi:hypothetical protein
VAEDPRFGQVKVFSHAIMTPMAVSESGYIGIYTPPQKKAVMVKPGGLLSYPKYEEEEGPEEFAVLHINQVSGFKLITDNKSGLGAAVAGGLLFGTGGAVVGQAISSGKAKSIDLQIKMNDFQNPQIVVPLYRAEGAGNTLLNPLGVLGKSVNSAMVGGTQRRTQEIQELMSSLDNLLQAAQVVHQEPAPAVQQASSADELAKFKKLLDDGVISQDEFDAKKKLLLGL